MRAQGSLEYLIIITVAIAILAVVTSFVIGYFSTQSDQFYYASCSDAASLCKNTLIMDYSNECPTCDNACNFSNGTEIFNTAALCCKQGKPESIYRGSPGCTAPPAPICGNTFREGTEQCDDGNTAGGDGCSPTCQIEIPTPICGNTFREGTEQCDDGNTAGGDGCSPTCQIEIPTPPLYFNELNISNLPVAVLSVAIGNVDNTGSNEIVIGMASTQDELRVYHVDKNGNSYVIREIAYYDLPTSVQSVAVGDADNDGGNEIIVGLDNNVPPGNNIPYGLRMYKYSSGRLLETNITNYTYPNCDITGVAVANVDDVAGNEIINSGWCGLNVTNKTASGWKTTNLMGTAERVSIGDFDGDGDNEIGAVDNGGARSIFYYNSASKTYQLCDRNVNSMAGPFAIGNAKNTPKGTLIYRKGGYPSYVHIFESIAGWCNGGGITTRDLDTVKYLSWTGGADVIVIGDANNDGKNEVVSDIGSWNGTNLVNNLRKQNYDAGAWIETNISRDFDGDVYAIAIGDVTGDYKNEVVAGLGTTEYPLRVYFP